MAPGIVSDAPATYSQDDIHHISPKQAYPNNASSEEHAHTLDTQDPLRHFRDQFIIPTKTSIKATSLFSPTESTKVDKAEDAIYFCGNSLGLRPKRTSQYIQSHLSTWSSIAVAGHFTQLTNSPLKPWQEMADFAASQSCNLVGAEPGEVAVANTLTVNLHLLMASFYRPRGARKKVLLEWKAFPSDHVSATLMMC